MTAIRFALVGLLITLVVSALGATYHDPQERFTFAVPTGWSATSVGGDVNVSDGGASYVRILNVPGGGKDLQRVKRVINQIGAQWQNFTQTSSDGTTLAGHRGISVLFTGVNPKGVESTLRVVAAPFGDNAFMLLMAAPSGDFLKIQEAFKEIEASFAVGAEGAKPAPKPEQTHSSPDRVTADSLQTSEVTGGGYMLHGALKDVSSGVSAFKAGLGRTRGYFDASLNLLSVVRGKDNPNLCMASFTAVRRGAPVGGLVVSVYDPDGSSRFAVLYDAPGHLAKSLPPMLKRFDESTQEILEHVHSSGGNAAMDFAHFEQASKHVTLNRVDFPDGTASIGVAADFKPQLMSGGRFTAASADGAYITLFRPCNALDPNGTLYKLQAQLGRNTRSGPMHVPGQVVLAYDADPVSAWKKYMVENARQNKALNPEANVLKSAPVPGGSKDWPQVNIAGTMTVNGEPFVFTGMLVGGPPPSAQGGWSVQVTLLVAPSAHAATDMPAMIAMQQSEKVDMNAVRSQTTQNIAAMNEQTRHWLASNKAAYDVASQRRFDSAMANARASRDAMDRSTAGFIHYISDTSIVQHNPSGAHGTLDKNLASALEKADPQHFNVVPVKEYVKGVDY